MKTNTKLIAICPLQAISIALCFTTFLSSCGSNKERQQFEERYSKKFSATANVLTNKRKVLTVSLRQFKEQSSLLQRLIHEYQAKFITKGLNIKDKKSFEAIAQSQKKQQSLIQNSDRLLTRAGAMERKTRNAIQEYQKFPLEKAQKDFKAFDKALGNVIQGLNRNTRGLRTQGQHQKKNIQWLKEKMGK